MGHVASVGIGQFADQIVQHFDFVRVAGQHGDQCGTDINSPAYCVSCNTARRSYAPKGTHRGSWSSPTGPSADWAKGSTKPPGRCFGPLAKAPIVFATTGAAWPPARPAPGVVHPAPLGAPPARDRPPQAEPGPWALALTVPSAGKEFSQPQKELRQPRPKPSQNSLPTSTGLPNTSSNTPTR